MLPRRLPLLAAALAVALSGCFHVSSVISVRPDGSATVRDSVAFSGFLALAMAEAQESGEGPGLFDRDQAEARARELGAGVRLDRFELLDAGYVAVYAAPDIRAVRYSAPDLESDSDDDPESPPDPDVELRFLFETGDPATLRVLVQKPPLAKRAASGSGGEGEGAEDDGPNVEGLLSGLGSTFGDARMVVSLRVEGEVVETTAAYADGSEVTLFDLPFSALFENADVLARIGREAPSGSAAYELLDGMEGVRVQQPGTVRVRFR